MYLTVSETTEIAITVVAHIDGDYPDNDRKIQWTINGTNDGTDNISSYTSSVSHTFYGLMPGSTYSISATMGLTNYYYEWTVNSDSSGGSFSTNFSTLYSGYDYSTSNGDIWTTGSSIDVTWEPWHFDFGNKHSEGTKSSDSGYISSGNEIYYITSQDNGTMTDTTTGDIIDSDENADWSERIYMSYDLRDGGFTTESDSVTASTVSAGPTLYTVTVQVNNSNDGSASANSTSVEYGASVIITATPKTNCEFDHWIIVSGEADIADGYSASTSLNYINSDVTVMAFFIRYYTITVSVNNSAYGTASANYSEASANTQIKLTATPKNGYEFVEWQVESGNITIQDNSWFWMPESNVSIKAVFQKKPRPDFFAWDTDKIKGEEFNLTASEWNGLRANINLVLAYKGQTQYAYQSVNTGEKFTADHYNAVVTAIQSVNGYGTSLFDVASGKPITAACLNLLVSELNAIP